MTEIKTTGPIDSLLSEWTSAERSGDNRKLEDLLTNDFYGVGTLGFVLPKEAWLARHRQGLTYETFDLEQIRFHLYPDFALATSQNNARGSYQAQFIPKPYVTQITHSFQRAPRYLRHPTQVTSSRR
jgi:hypothetical protein